MGIVWKTLLFAIPLFAKLSVIAALPLGDTEIVGNTTAISVTLTEADDEVSFPPDFSYDGRIVGGQLTSIVNYPYQVSLQRNRAHICGGSILSHNVILTAAHCIEKPQDVASYQVRAGSSSHLFGGQLIGVQHIIKHESYTTTELDCDVALVVLSRNLVYTLGVMPVELAATNEAVPNNKPLLVSGWGLRSETGTLPDYLNFVDVRLINRYDCAASYQYVATITGQMFCAGYPQGGKDSCQGDSGGPLVSYVDARARTAALTTSSAPSSTSSLISLPSSLALSAPATGRLAQIPVQYGIVSWGIGCAQRGNPGVYADVGALRPWIDAKLREISYFYN